MNAPDPQALADLHASAFRHPRPWRAAEFAALLDDPQVIITTAPATPDAPPQAVAVVRIVLDEAEVLTLAVAPAWRRRGLGQAVLNDALARAHAAGATASFLEVAADNAAALALYGRMGFRTVGRRRGYYDAGTDALILRR
ncbi:MAG: GNAT family N-acetyltransferase [Rhodobacteraceae bacterium]|nr:GNAT family N-acetyltransferase [Paracoccaceae bacterium]